MDSDSDASLDDFKVLDYSRNQLTSLSYSQVNEKQTLKSPEKEMKTGKSSHVFGLIQPSDGKMDQRKKNVKVVSEKSKRTDSLHMSSVEETVERTRCPTCGKIFSLTDIVDHSFACLQENYKVCKSSEAEARIMIIHPKTSAIGSELHKESFLCFSCGCDLTCHSADQRNIHITSCLHDSKKVLAERSKNSTEKVSQSANCPFCLKTVTHVGLKRHLVACQRKCKFSTMVAMSLHCPEDKAVDDELLAQIRKSYDGSEMTSSQNTVRQKKTRKRCVEKNTETYYNEILQLAVAVSTNKDLENQSKKRRLVKRVVEPIMMASCLESRQNQLKNRLREIVCPENILADHEGIPITPSLPATSLKISRVWRIIPKRKLFADNENLYPHPKVSSSLHFDFKNDSKAVLKCSSPIASPESGASDASDKTGFSKLYASNCCASFKKGSSLSFESGDYTNAHVFTKWTLTKSSSPAASQYHVSGLLSQFDGRKNRLAILSAQNADLNATLDNSIALERDCSELEGKEIPLATISEQNNKLNTTLDTLITLKSDCSELEEKEKPLATLPEQNKLNATLYSLITLESDRSEHEEKESPLATLSKQNDELNTTLDLLIALENDCSEPEEKESPLATLLKQDELNTTLDSLVSSENDCSEPEEKESPMGTVSKQDEELNTTLDRLVSLENNCSELKEEESSMATSSEQNDELNTTLDLLIALGNDCSQPEEEESSMATLSKQDDELSTTLNSSVSSNDCSESEEESEESPMATLYQSRMKSLIQH